MASTVMLYVLPMLLGQTYDLGKEKPGLLIYPKNIVDKAVKIDRYFTDSQYRMVENVDDMRDFLDVSGKLSLKIKGGLVNVNGEGSYLKDSSSKSNGLEILVKLHFETVTFTIPTSVKPNADWSTLPNQFLGTHYCRSITYGGDLVASIRITGSGRHDLERIKGAISVGVNAGGGSFEGDIKGKLELVKQSAEDSSSMEINYYASVPLHGVSYSIDGLLKLIDDFPNHVKKVNKGLGNPLRMELYPLNSLKEEYPAYLENKALSDELDDLDSQFDDLRDTRRQLGIWITQLPPEISDAVQKKIDEFTNKLNSVYGVYMNTIANLDVSQGASTQAVKAAFEVYRDGSYILPQKYDRKLRSLQREIYQDAPELQPKNGGAHYIHWGRSDCNSGSDISMHGVLTASEILKVGGSSDFVCSSLDPQQVKVEDYFVGYKSTGVHKSDSLLSPAIYKGKMDIFKSMSDKKLACAHCRLASRTAIMVKMAANSCPDNWVKEYEGYAMAPSTFGVKGEFICIDKDIQEPSGSVLFGNTFDSRAQEVQEITISCGALPCGPYEESKAIPCVVCTT